MQEPVSPVRPGRPVLTYVAVGIALVAVVASGVAFALRNSVALGVVRSAARSAGYAVGSVDGLDVGFDRASARNVAIRNAADEPVLTAKSIAVGFSLRDLLPGGKRLFGLTSVRIVAPRITVIHHSNGSYNITVPQSKPQPAASNAPPLDVAIDVSDATVVLIDRFVNPAREHTVRFSGGFARGQISPASGSSYHAGALFDDGSGRYRIRGNARFDDPRGFEVQHWTAARLPIAALANFALSTHAIVVEGGEVRDLDAKIGALATPVGTMQTHIGASGRLSAVRVASAAILQPVRDARGTFVVDDDSATVRALDARLNGLVLHLSGSLYHFAAPQVAFAITVRGDLAQARALSKDSAHLPVGGPLQMAGLAEGPATNPTVFARVTARRTVYGTYRFDAGHGFAALSGKQLDLVDAGVGYGPAVLGLRASLALASHTRTTGYATIGVPTAGLPYAANLLPDVQLNGVAAFGGEDARLSARGYVAGATNGNRLDAPFALAASGSGSVGPVVLERRDGASVFARAVIDARRKQTVVVADVRHLSLLPASLASLPGVTVPPIPPHIDGTLDANLAGLLSGTTLAAANGELHAAGSWGDVRAVAAGSGSNLAARGRLTSSFERLAALTGALGARGGIDVPFALSSAGQTTLLQVQAARFPHADVRGIALQGLSATVGLAGRAIDVYAADLRIAGHDVTAAGRFGDGGHVHVTAGDLDLDPVRAAGVPVHAGRATVLADIGGTSAAPTASLVAALAEAEYAGSSVGGDVDLAYAGSQLRIDRATVTYGGAYATAAGTVAGLAPGRIAPRYDIAAQLEDADIAALARTVKNPLRYPAGTLAANLRVTGAGTAPAVRGELLVPEGSINGLPFNDGRVGIDADASKVSARDGRVTVGSSTLAFAGAASRSHQQASLRAPRLDLADFNDYFDEADVLAGRGRIALGVDAAPNRLAASADVALRDTRYRRFELGRVDAAVRTAGTTVALTGSIAGSNGHLTVAGTVKVPADNPLHDIVRRSYVDLSTQIAGIDLGNVLPAAGLDVPVFGIIDGAASVRGRYPALALRTHAALTRGVVGRVPIERFTVAATAANGRGHLSDATLLVPGLSARVSGTFGVRPQDALGLTVHAASPDINQLITTATGKNPGLRGTISTDALVNGSLVQPRLASTVDLANVTYASVAIPAVHAEIAATRTTAAIRNGSLTLPHSGSIAFDGRAPIGGGRSAPIAFDFIPHNVELSPYSALLPDGSVIAGVFNGNVGVRGTLHAPLLSGTLGLRDGEYRSNTFRSGLTALGFDLNFGGTQVALAGLHAKVGSGNIDGSGTVSVRDLADPVHGLLADAAITLAGVRVAAPKYYTGFIDGTITARKQSAAPLTVGGNLTFSNARIPYTALVPSGGSATTPAPALPAVALALGVTVGRDVRVQSGPVDIGTTGVAQLGGTLAAPTLDGQFAATDGTVSLYRTFVVQNGSTVAFDPTNGITPTVDATAVTNVPDPPTNVLLHVTGLSTHLNLDFSSDPPYSQQQILGLLVGAQSLGAVSGVAQNGGTSTSGFSIAGVGEGFLSNQFTQKFLQPFSSKLGGALGLSDLNLNYSLNGTVSATARRAIGKNISFVYGEQFGGTTQRSSVGINIGTQIAGAQLTFFQTTGSQSVISTLTPFLQSGFLSPTSPNYALQAIEPPYGSGFVFTYQRKYW